MSDPAVPWMLSPHLDDSTSHQTGQREWVTSSSGGSSLKIQIVVSGAGSVIGHSSMACPDEERPCSGGWLVTGKKQTGCEISEE